MIGKRGAEEREGGCYRQFQTNKLFIKISCHVITADVRKRVREIQPSHLYVLRIQAATVWGWEWQGRDSLGNGLLCAAYFYSCALLLQPRSHLLLPLKSKESPKLLFPCREFLPQDLLISNTFSKLCAKHNGPFTSPAHM